MKISGVKIYKHCVHAGKPLVTNHSSWIFAESLNLLSEKSESTMRQLLSECRKLILQIWTLESDIQCITLQHCALMWARVFARSCARAVRFTHVSRELEQWRVEGRTQCGIDSDAFCRSQCTRVLLPSKTTMKNRWWARRAFAMCRSLLWQH